MTKHIALQKMSRFVAAFTFLTVTLGAGNALAQLIECASVAGKVKAVADPTAHFITTRYQLDTPNLESLFRTTVRTGKGCLVAHLSALARITDNYVALQVRVDGVPLEGHLPGLAGLSTPVVPVLIDSGAPPFDDEQFIDPTKVLAYNFFGQVDAGVHVVEVLGAAGSSIDSTNLPSVFNLVLTLEHR